MLIADTISWRRHIEGPVKRFGHKSKRFTGPV
jgi:hypothetical protein